jgi:hypothetical protein
MSPEGSVSGWLGQLKDGDPDAAQHLWQRYFARLVGLARARLQGTPRQAADEEDVALSAFKSFCAGVKQGRFPRLDDRDDLWRLLVTLTARKAAHLRRYHRQIMRPPEQGRDPATTVSFPPGSSREGAAPGASAGDGVPNRGLVSAPRSSGRAFTPPGAKYPVTLPEGAGGPNPGHPLPPGVELRPGGRAFPEKMLPCDRALPMPLRERAEGGRRARPHFPGSRRPFPAREYAQRG